MRVGFTVIRQEANVEVQVHSSGAKKHPDLVTWSQQHDDFAVLMGYLYYRYAFLADLASRCSNELLRECETNNATLALAAYRALGIGSLERIEGDFALVIWDAERSHLIGMRDPMGGYPLFWTGHESTVIFSTSLRPLLDLRGRRSLNMEYFAEFVMMPAQRNEGASESCAYEGICRVLPGTVITVGRPTNGVERRVYWDWLAQLKDPGTDNLVEVAEQYRDLLQTAVRERMRGRTLAHLSGGMDSTSIALIARDLVHAGVGEAPLHTLSLVYDRLPILTRERPYIEGVLQHQPEIVAHRLPADDLLDYDSFADPPPHEEPYAGLWRLAMDRATIDVASQIGAVTILTGLGSDEIHDVHPYYLTDLLRHGRLLKAWQEAYKWAQASNCSPWAILQPFGIANLPPAWLLDTRAGNGERRSPTKLHEQTDWTVPPWITSGFAHRYELRNRAVKNARQVYHQCWNTTLSLTVSTLASRPGDILRWSVAAPLGIAIAHPFLDARLLSLGLGIQARIQPVPGKMKPVLAAAMGDRLPTNIQERRRKGHFNEVYYLGLARNLPQLEVMIRNAPAETWEMFDQAILMQSLQEASLAGVGARQLQRLNYTLSLIKWLCMQHEYQPVESSPAKIIQVPQQNGVHAAQ